MFTCVTSQLIRERDGDRERSEPAERKEQEYGKPMRERSNVGSSFDDFEEHRAEA